jgi:hypothetical protein
MTIKLFCNRCDEPGDITTRRFAGGIDVTATQSQSPSHLCEDCLSELLLEAVISMEDTPTAKDYAASLERAAQTSKAFAAVERTTAECDSLKEKLQEARTQATAAGQYSGWLKERGELFEKIEALEAARDVALTRAAQAEKNAAEVAKRAQAAQVQAKVDEKDAPEYVAAVREREAKRASGKAN